VRSTATTGGLVLARQEPPVICVTSPPDWSDSLGYTCDHYESREYCAPDGSLGAGWPTITIRNQSANLWGPLERYAWNGIDASMACCACGGGRTGPAVACTALQCPLGFSAKPGADQLYCAGLECTLDADVDTCCQACPEVEVALGQARAISAQLRPEVRSNISEVGQAQRFRAADAATAARTQLVAEIAESFTAARDTALADARADFDSLTENSDSLAEAARHQITASGFLAARAAYDSGDASVSGAGIEAAVHNLTQRYGADKKAWQGVGMLDNASVELSRATWNDYQADLNETWPAFVSSIGDINAAIDVMEVPGREVRRASPTLRLAADFSQVAQGQVGTLRSQVNTVERQAAQALQTTQLNGQRVSSLTAMVDEALSP